MLTRVTITGADDRVAPSALVELSARFPWVEWGILFSPKRTGTPRYPTTEWVCSLEREAVTTKMHLAAHFCGVCTRETLAGDPKWLAGKERFARVQLNGYVPPAPVLVEMAQLRLGAWPEFILQVCDEASLQAAAHDAAALGPASALYDPSGGRGIEAFRWPRAPLGLRLGYAGGIKPSTVEEVLRDIGPVDHEFWIDCESGVRTDDALDLDLVLAMLKKTAPFVVVS